MPTLGDLADELNRQEWAVVRMLKNRGYLRQDGNPRKSTIDAGLMNKNGLISRAGWSCFIDELGYKDTDEEVDDEIECESEAIDDEEDVEDGDIDNEDNYDEIEAKIRVVLTSQIKEKSLLYDLSSQLIEFYKQWKAEDDEYWDIDSVINSLCENVLYYSSQGHTDTFLRAFVSEYETFVNDDVDDTYSKMTEDEIFDDIESVLNAKGYNENTIKWAREEEFQEYRNIFSLCDSFEKIFDEAVDKGNDEEISCKYARERMITDDIGFPSLPSYSTSLELGQISDENIYEEIWNWIEEKYQVNVIYLDLDDNIVFFDYNDLIYKGSINYLDEELEIVDYYLPSEKQNLGL